MLSPQTERMVGDGGGTHVTVIVPVAVLEARGPNVSFPRYVKVSVPQKLRSGVYSTSVVLEMVRVPFEVVAMIPEIERVSQPSVSVSFEMRSMRVAQVSSVMVMESLVATGASLTQLTVMSAVATFEREPLASSVW